MADSSKTPEWRFSIKDLMIATAIVALGLFLAVGARDPRWHPYVERYWFVVLTFFFGGCAIAGIGVMYQFKKLKLGAWLGVAAGIAWLVYALITH